MLIPTDSLTMSAAYNVGDFRYGKNGYDMKDKVFRSTTGFVTQFFNDKLRLKGDFTLRNSEDNEKRRQVPVPYSNHPGVIAYVGTTTNDLRETRDQRQYLAANLFGEFENIFNDAHYLKVLIGYNYEQSTYAKSTCSEKWSYF